VLQIVVEFANNVTFDNERLKATLPFGHLDATTMADYLVHKGMPFRSGHEVVGKAVAMAEKKKCQLQVRASWVALRSSLG
jgi:argininosuccinate lyase